MGLTGADRISALLPLLLLFGAPPAAAGQAGGGPATEGRTVVRSARLTAEVPPSGADAEVRIEYRVALKGAAAPLRLEILGMGPASVDRFRVETAEGTEGDPFALALERGSMRATTLPVPAPVPGSDEVTLSLAYRVTGAVERSGPGVRVRLPVLVLDLPPEAGGARIFRASVRLPDEWALSGGFPSGLVSASGGAWEVDLAAVPALVSLRGRSDGGWRPGLLEALDALAVMVVLGFGFVGWRHLRTLAA